jgi:hypothetical protein
MALYIIGTINMGRCASDISVVVKTVAVLILMFAGYCFCILRIVFKS